MSYGHFSADGREFIVTTPLTPRPWANYLTNGRYCALVSHTGGGYSFADSSGYHRLTRAHPAAMVLEDRPGRYVYLRDEDTGRFWSINWQPVQAPYQSWEARHGQGYTVIRSLVEDVEGEILYFVPLDQTLEVWRVRIANRGAAPRRLSFFPYAEWALGNYAFDLLETGFAKLFKTVEHRQGVIVADMRLWNLAHGPAKPHLVWPRSAFMGVSFPVVSYDCVRESFVGMYRSLANPAAVVNGHCANSESNGQDAVAAFHGRVELPPGQEYVFTVVLGTAEDGIHGLVERYRDLRLVEEEWARLRAFWDEYLGRFWVQTPDPDFDLSCNVWNKYQCWITFNWSRMASYYIGGGSIVGFRDSSQDLLGVLPVNADWAKKKIVTMWRHQFSDGGTLHNWDPITDTGPRTGHSDDALWPVLATVWYLRETGDLAFLDERIPFYDHGEGTVLQHLERSLTFTLGRRSPRGIPLIGEADWNDALDQVGIEGKGESTMTAGFLCWMLRETAEILRARGDEEGARRWEAAWEEVADAVNRHMWDGRWYVRATTDRGEPVGSHVNRYGRIHLDGQTWPILAGIADRERALACLESIRELLDTPYGPCLFLPAYQEVDETIGILTMFAPGVKENGTIFNHPVCWTIMAEALLRRPRAYELWKRTSFLTRGREPDRYKAEPYVYAEYVYGADSPLFGQGEFTWMTGTAAWMLRACLDWILGVRPELEGLRVDPVIPAEWEGFTVRRRFRGADYVIRVENPERVSSGVVRVTVDGRDWPGLETRRGRERNLLPAFADGREHEVLVLMGTGAEEGSWAAAGAVTRAT